MGCGYFSNVVRARVKVRDRVRVRVGIPGPGRWPGASLGVPGWQH